MLDNYITEKIGVNINESIKNIANEIILKNVNASESANNLTRKKSLKHI